jgi:hypothetical protein
MQRSLLVGDDTMVRALAYCAAPSPEDAPPRWPAVIAAWKASDPAVRETLDDYDAAWQELTDQQQRVEDANMFRLPAEQPPPDRDQLPHLEPASDGSAT